MTSQSAYTQQDRQLYNNQLSDYFSALAGTPLKDPELSKADETNNEILNELTFAGATNLIDEGVQGAKDMVKSGIKKVKQKGLEIGKEYGKQAVSKLAERAGIPEETVRDMLDGKLDGVKTVSQAVDYIKNKAQTLGSQKVAELRDASGAVSDSVRAAGEDTADKVARAGGLADGALNNNADRLAAVTDFKSQFDFQKLPDAQQDLERTGADFFTRIGNFFGGKKVTPAAATDLVNQAPREVDASFTDPFTGRKIDTSAKFRPPEGADFGTDASDALEGIAAGRTPQFNPTVGSGLERFKVLQGATTRYQPQLGQLEQRTRDMLDKESAYQDAVSKRAEQLGSDFGKYTPRVQPTNTAKATASLTEIAEDKAGSAVAPGYKVLADVTKTNASELSVLEKSALGKLAAAGSDLVDPLGLALAGTVGGGTAEQRARRVGVQAGQDAGTEAVSQLASKGVSALGSDSVDADEEVQRLVDAFDAKARSARPVPDSAPSAAAADPDPAPAAAAAAPDTEDKDADAEEGEEEEGDDEKAPPPDDEAAEAAKAEAAEQGEKDTGGDIGKLVEKGLLEGGEETAEGGGDPIADIVGLGIALGTIFGGALGQKHAGPPPPLPNFSNPSVPVGI